MTIPYTHLRFALAQLAHARTQLNEALRLAKAQDYGPEWIEAIDLALGHNEETNRQVGDILTNIRPLRTIADERPCASKRSRHSDRRRTYGSARHETSP